MRIPIAGALGEVGRSVAAAFVDLGHEVLPVSSRAPLASHEAALTQEEARRLLREGGADAVVNAAGRGDRRQVLRTGHDSTASLAGAAAENAVPAVLLSTTRVLEGYEADVDEDAVPAARTPYAEANAENERLWLSAGGSSVVRIVNYFCLPSSANSPQVLLLPWSLVTEALADRRITVRSAPAAAKAFVDSDDVARACLAVLAADQPPTICATTPGVSLTMDDLAQAASQAVRAELGGEVTLSFGVDSTTAPVVRAGWLSAHDWVPNLSRQSMTDAVRRWLRDQDPSAAL